MESKSTFSPDCQDIAKHIIAAKKPRVMSPKKPPIVTTDEQSVTMAYWQDGKTLRDCSRYMLENQIGCDVTFLVGQKGQEIRAHKFILISRSPVFQAMLCGPLGEKQTPIPIPDIEPHSFGLILRYMYYDAMIAKKDQISEILYAAKKYCLSNLVKICRDKLSKWITTDNACELLHQALMLDDSTLVRQCQSFVLKNGELCLKSAGMGKLSRDCVTKVFEADDLLANELTLSNALVNWAQAVCKRLKENVTSAKIREILGDMLYSVRFHAISPEDFAKHVSVSDILSKDEIISFFSFTTEHVKVSRSSPQSLGEPFAVIKDVTGFAQASLSRTHPQFSIPVVLISLYLLLSISVGYFFINLAHQHITPFPVSCVMLQAR
ncbi:hypothetical protein ScPMuIL_014018 [Solemya velum]